MENISSEEQALQSIRQFQDSDMDTRYQAVEALIALGEPAILPLIAALKDSDSYVRYYATEALVQLGDTRAVLPLIEAFKHPDGSVLYLAPRALVHIGEPAVLPLVETLQDADREIRSQAVLALREIGDVRAVLPLIETLADRDLEVRARATSALKRIGEGQSLPQKTLASEALTPAQKADILLALQRVKPLRLRNALGAPDGSLETRCQTLRKDQNLEPAVRQGAQEVVNELQRRAHSALLLRPGVGNPPARPEEMLRMAAGQPDGDDTDELMRATDTPPVREDRVKKRGLFGLFRK